MDAFIGQRFEDFETITGVNVIKLYGDSLLLLYICPLVYGSQP